MTTRHLFWGILLILAGVSIVCDNVFCHIWSIMKYLFAAVLVYKGLSLIFGPEKPHYHFHKFE